MIAISRLRDTQYQRKLFDAPLGNHGHRRTVVGELIELITVRIFGGRRHRCYGASYCPDVSAGGRYFECKAMGRSRSVLVYSGRLDKDSTFVVGNELYYVVWHHTADTMIPQTVTDLQLSVLMNLKWGAVMPFAHLEQLCLWTRPTRLNSAYGGRAGSYGSGYRIPARFIEPWIMFECNDYAKMAETIDVSLSGSGIS